MRVSRSAVMTAVVGTLLLTSSTWAQLSSPANTTTGSTCSGANNADGFCGSAATVTVNTAAQVEGRYGWNINADVGAGATRDTSGNAQHNFTFNATAPGGYRVTLTNRFTGDMNRVNDVVNCSGQSNVSGVTGNTNIGLTTGSLNIADPGAIGNGSSTTSTPFNTSAVATICRVSNGVAQAHSLSFTWNGNVRSNSCEAAVRLGNNSGTVTGCSACAYPGSPGRTQATDGQFITVDYVSFCGNGVVDSCGPVTEQCDQGGLNGTAGSCCTSTCQFRAAGQVCRAVAGVCDQQETCTGASATCPADVFLGTSTQCRASAGICDVAENCSGSSANCPADLFLPTTTVCRGSAGICDVAENCTGSGALCPTDLFQPTTTVCRGSAGICDVAENCTGSGALCPTDVFQPTTTVCRGVAGICDVAENCTGSGASCPADAFEPTTVECRASAGFCDVAENCSGSAAACPTDVFQPTTLECRASAGVCDPAENCTGSAAACPGDAKSVALCRASTDVCDVDEFCDGTNDDCPADLIDPAGVVCRPVAGVCDVQEVCDGVDKACPADSVSGAFVVCRPSVGQCDVTENCDGTNVDCPADGKSTAECRANQGVCDIAENCDGVNDDCPADAKSVALCRPTAAFCDVDDFCDGVNNACPTDQFDPYGLHCDDSNFCTLVDICDGLGNCLGTVNAQDGIPCTDGVACTAPDTCQGGVCTSQPVDCDDVNPCTDDHCDSAGGGFLCVHDNNGICIGPNCGNAVVDGLDGETCDPPNLAINPVTGFPVCRLDCTSCGDGILQAQNSETCDDGNTVSGCDPQSPAKELDPCLNNCTFAICEDPAKISFRPGLDQFKMHARLITDQTLDLVGSHFVVEVRSGTDANEVYFRASLPVNQMTAIGTKAVKFKNKYARAIGGMMTLKAIKLGGYYSLTLQAYGEFLGAQTDMTTSVYVGNQEWNVRGNWKEKTKGWVLNGKTDLTQPQG